MQTIFAVMVLERVTIMAEYIGCRKCDSTYCDGCNLKTLETMLEGGRFDCLMGNNHTINPTADVVEVRYANITASNGFDEWAGTVFECGGCGCNWMTLENETNYCPNCGAKMDGKGEGE